MSASVVIRDVTFSYGRQAVLDDINLEVQAGEFVALLGPSGCGKSTLLGLMCGFLEPSQGSVLLDGVEVTTLSPIERNIGMVFQDYALFPHMTVAENVGYGLKARRWSKAQIREKVETVLGMAGLRPFRDRYPRQLSGGQRQRVAVARSIAIDPRLLLMDEPFSSLDAKLRQDLRADLKGLLEQTGATVVLVTHDQEEALELADRVALLREGRLEQYATPREIYRRPQTAYAAQFVGEANIFEGRVIALEGESARIDLGACVVSSRAEQHGVGAQVQLVVRPEAVRLEALGSNGSGIPGTVIRSLFNGSEVRYLIDVGENRVMRAQVPAREDRQLADGQRVLLTWKAEESVLLAVSNGVSSSSRLVGSDGEIDAEDSSSVHRQVTGASGTS